MPNNNIYKLPPIRSHLDFYITNVCNLTCEECFTLSNYKFKGHQSWKDYAEIYKEWSGKLDIWSHIRILGGEPLLVPDIIDWIEGIKTCWPDNKLTVTTNGYRLNHVKNLYNTLLKHRGSVELTIARHNPNDWETLNEIINNFLVAPITTIRKSTQTWKRTDTTGDLYIRDSNGVTIVVENQWIFSTSGVKFNSDLQKYNLHNSDPEKAHNICLMRHCHSMIKGKLYKCVPSFVFSEFDKQNNLDISDEDRHLLNSYTPLSVDDDYVTSRKFILGLNNSIPQCKFCPQEHVTKKIFSIEKKNS